MTPTLFGRLQTRVILLGTVGVAWMFFITLLLPGPGALGDMYQVTYLALFWTVLLGLGWECAYHGLQQFRWEKDWPTLFGLLTGINEGLFVWLFLNATLPGDLGVTGAQFLIAFGTTWVVVWLFANGPMRVVVLRWRFRGGRVFGDLPR